jgi:hypothetical protein
MSSLWTPNGEVPAGTPSNAPTSTSGAADQSEISVDGQMSPEQAAQLEAEFAEMRAQVLATPAADIVANHIYGLFELGAMHLGNQPPNLADAALAIDAMGAILDRVGDRLGSYDAQLQDGLAQLRMAFVQIKAAMDAGASPTA